MRPDNHQVIMKTDNSSIDDNEANATHLQRDIVNQIKEPINPKMQFYKSSYDEDEDILKVVAAKDTIKQE